MFPAVPSAYPGMCGIKWVAGYEPAPLGNLPSALTVKPEPLCYVEIIIG